MTDNRIREGLDKLNNIDKPVEAKNKATGKKSSLGKIKDEVRFNDGENLHVIQQIELLKPKDGEKFAYRCGYYTYDKNGKKRYWGGAPSILKGSEFAELYSKAIQKGWFR